MVFDPIYSKRIFLFPLDKNKFVVYNINGLKDNRLFLTKFKNKIHETP